MPLNAPREQGHHTTNRTVGVNEAEKIEPFRCEGALLQALQLLQKSCGSVMKQQYEGRDAHSTRKLHTCHVKCADRYPAVLLPC